MFILLKTVLDEAALAAVRDKLAAARWVDGRKTAGWHARAVKANEQAEGAGAEAAAGLVRAGLDAHDAFQAAALPRHISPILFSRYGAGMAYGPHVDDAVMRAGGTQMRSDLAATLFLSEEDAYQGGALVIESVAGEEEIRLAAGDAVLYPATTLHRVAPVEAGERLAAVFWVQSLVRDAGKREILFDLDRARRAVFAREGGGEAFALIAKTHANLLRRWAEP